MNNLPLLDGQSGDQESLALAARAALRNHPPIRMWKDAIHIRVQGDSITLSGMVRNDTTRELAERLVKGVSGVQSVDNQLVSDDQVEVAVAEALGGDPRVSGSFPGILVGVIFGIAYLKGTAPTEQVKAAAGEIAATVPGVHSVSNELIVAPGAKGTA